MEIKEKLIAAAKVFFLMGDKATAHEILEFLAKLEKLKETDATEETDKKINVVFEVSNGHKD